MASGPGGIIACSSWYAPKAYDADMTRDMDAALPWVWNGPTPDIRLGHLHYRIFSEFS